MAIKKHRIFAIVAVILLAVMCFGLSACNNESTSNPLSIGEASLSTAVDGKLEDMLKSVTLTFKDSNLDDNGNGTANEEGEDDSFTATGLADIRAKGVIVNWTGSSQEVKDRYSKYTVTFNYLGNILVVSYTFK